MKLQGRNLEPNLRGKDVALLQSELKHLKLQTPIVDPDGFFGSTTFLAVQEFQRAHGLAVTGIVDEHTVRTINRVVAAQPRETWVVRGSVLQPDGDPVPKTEVRAFEKHLRSETLLGESSTNGRGEYEIKYPIPKNAALSLIVRAFDSQDKELVASSVICKVSPVEVVDLVVGDEPYRGLSEFKLLQEALMPLLQQESIAVADLSEEDVILLSCQNDLDAEHLAYFVVSERLMSETHLQAEWFYGLVRQSLPTNLIALVAHSPEILRSALETSVRDNIVGIHIFKIIPEILSSLQQQIVRLALHPSEPDRPTLGSLLDIAGVRTTLKEKILSDYLKREGTVEEFWTRLREQPDVGGKMVDSIQYVVQLAAVTLNHEPMVRELIRMRDRRELGADLRDLARLNRDDWQMLINRKVGEKSIGAPSVLGEDESQRTEQYALFLERMVEATFPTTVLGHRLAELDPEKFAPTIAFLRRNPDFDFNTMRLHEYLRERPNAIEGTSTEAPEQLRAVQRMMNIAPAFNKVSAVRLIADGIQSALSVRRMGAPQFLRVHSGQFDNVIEAQQFYIKAARQADTALLLGSMTMGFNPTHITITAPHLFGEGIPDLEDLFGSLDLCQCEQCGSVYSPAAYLVDILHFLMNRPANSPNKTALDVLYGNSQDPRQRRRADIGHIELTCQNTNTLLPYVDLVNEILERVVAPGGESSFQTQAEADVLAANPEHLNVAAYNRLAQAIYPWTLPFSLWAAEVHSYLSQIGTQRYALMEAFIPDNASEFMLDTATEYLGLTPQEREIITDSRTNMTASYWGMETGEFNILLSDRRAAVILQQSGLSYKELTAVLEVHAVNMGTAMRIQFVGADCNLDTATITNLSTERLSRFHRFVRLQRKLGWPILELGNLLEIMNVNELDNSALLFLAQIKRIRGALKPSWEILSTWWNRSNRIDTRNHDGQPSLYDRIFNDPSINPPTLEIFELNSARDELEENNLRISEHVDAVSRAIGINTDDLNLLVAEPDELPNDNLNLANLTRIYSVVTFTRAAKISIREYLIMRALTGLNPLGHEQLTQAERFIQLLQEVRASKMNLAVLDYLLRHQITPDPAVLDESQIHKFLEKLQTSLQKIAVDHTFISDPTGKRVTELLASLLPGELANRVVAILDGSTNENQDVLSSLLNDNLAQFLDPNEAFAQLVSPGTLARPEDRFDYVLERLLPFLARNASDALVIESVASAMGISTEIADDLLRRLVPAPGDPLLSSLEVFLSADFINATDAAFSDQHVTFHRLAKIAIMLNALSISSEHVEFVLRQGPALGWLDLAGLPLETQATASPLFEQWLQQVTLFRAVTRLTTGIAGLLKLISLLDDPALTHDAFFNRLAEFTSWDLTDIEFLAGQQGFDFDFPSGFVDGQFLLILKRCFELLNVMGITAQEARRWATPVVDDGIARAVKQAVRAKYPDQQQWLAIAKPIRDELREQQRAALVGYLVHEIRIQIPRLRVSNQPLAFLPPNLLSGPAVKELQLKLNIFISGTLSPPLRVTSFFDAFTDVALRSFQAANGLPVNGITTEATWAALDRVRQRLKGPEDLYAHFLIDVEMSSCMLTSRIVQATQSVQLFIQRCLLNLEPEVDLTPEDVKEWAWMKNYRVWEANRKVFLYPENWIEPELRDDKTPFFKRLESGLLQDTINDVTVEREYLKYLEELDRVAQLEISGLYRQWETDQDIQHVIGRTRNTPHLYYYRRWINQRYWTPWEKVDVDIEGDHLVPVVWNRRLYLFWPMFMERADEEVEHGEDEPNRFYEIRLAWSEYREGKWNPKQVSKISIKTPSKRGQLPEKFRFSFWSYLYQAGSLVIAYSSLEVIEPLHYAHFKFNGCNSEPEIILSTNGLNHSLKPFSNTDFYYNALKEEKIRQGETSSTSNMFLVVTSGNISRDGTRIELVRTKEQIVLNNTPGTFIIVYPHNERPKICHTPFFFQDNTRTFLVVPRTVPTRGSGGIGGSIEQAIELRPNTVPLELPDKIVSDVAAFTRRSAEPASDSFIDGILAPNDRAIPTAVLAATNTGNRETVAAIMDTTTAASRP
ncbi:MAG TPA: hypothetical protein DEO56_02920, partial [Nitrosomonas nitrosa]|nr:hypothetical protein [Nitrosomonas nitrosa]